MAIASENITSGMGTAAFVAFLMSLCNRRFSATQFALLSAFASVGRVWVGPLAGVLAQSIGWPAFFLASIVAALPALALLVVLRRPIELLEHDPSRRRRRCLTSCDPDRPSALRLLRRVGCDPARPIDAASLRAGAAPAPRRSRLAACGARGRRRRAAVGAAAARPGRADRARRDRASTRRCCSRRRSSAPSRPRIIRRSARLRYIADAHHSASPTSGTRARGSWRWEVNLIGSKQINAFCMPGGKIAFYYGILDQLKLTDDEVAMVMGHEMAHALREHAREQMGKTMATRGAIEIGAAILGLGSGGRLLADMGGQLLTLRFGRDDETEADLVGLELAARAGYDPRAGVTLWEKMAAANQARLGRAAEHAPVGADPDQRHPGQPAEGRGPLRARRQARAALRAAGAASARSGRRGGRRGRFGSAHLAQDALDRRQHRHLTHQRADARGAGLLADAADLAAHRRDRDAELLGRLRRRRAAAQRDEDARLGAGEAVAAREALHRERLADLRACSSTTRTARGPASAASSGTTETLARRPSSPSVSRRRMPRSAAAVTASASRALSRAERAEQLAGRPADSGWSVVELDGSGIVDVD